MCHSVNCVFAPLFPHLLCSMLCVRKKITHKRVRTCARVCECLLCTRAASEERDFQFTCINTLCKCRCDWLCVCVCVWGVEAHRRRRQQRWIAFECTATPTSSHQRPPLMLWLVNDVKVIACMWQHKSLATLRTLVFRAVWTERDALTQFATFRRVCVICLSNVLGSFAQNSHRDWPCELSAQHRAAIYVLTHGCITRGVYFILIRRDIHTHFPAIKSNFIH